MLYFTDAMRNAISHYFVNTKTLLVIILHNQVFLVIMCAIKESTVLLSHISWIHITFCGAYQST